MVTGSKEIFHLEAFVARFMALYKAYVASAFSSSATADIFAAMDGADDEFA